MVGLINIIQLVGGGKQIEMMNQKKFGISPVILIYFTLFRGRGRDLNVLQGLPRADIGEHR